MNSLSPIVINQIKSYQQKRRVRHALDHAYATFSQQYPRWTNSLFDIYFLRREVARTANWQYPLEPSTLVEAYLAAIGGQTMEQSHRRTAVFPVANAFVQLMATELQS